MSDVQELHRALCQLGPVGLLGALGVPSKAIRMGGRKARCACPIHHGDGLAFAVWEHEGVLVWRCLSGCDRGGDAIGLVAEIRGLDLRTQFPDVLREVGALVGLDVGAVTSTRTEPAPSEAEQRAAYLRNQALGLRTEVLSRLLELSPLVGEGLRYLTHERGLDASVCRAMRVGYVSDPAAIARDLLDRYRPEVLDELGVVYLRGGELAFSRHRLVVPIIRGGCPVYVQGRALGDVEHKHERFRSMRGSTPCLLGIDSLAARPDAPVLLCEGLVDTVTGQQMWGESHAVVGILGAGGLKPEMAAPLRGRTVVVALDPDAAGEKGAQSVAQTLHRIGCEVRRLVVPHPAKDLNDWLQLERAA